MKLFAAFCLGILLAHNANARLGETAIQFADRYGPPQDTPESKSAEKENPLLEGAILHLYKHQGWQIRAAFLALDGPAVRMEFSKIPPAGASPAIKDSEMRAIAAANKPPGMIWRKTIYDNPDSLAKGPGKTAEAVAPDMVGQKMWQRTDGAILWQPVPLVVRIELPAARRHEQIEQRKSQEARGRAPTF